MVLVPSLELVDEMYRRPSTPLIASSRGVVTDDSTVAAVAPVYVAVTVTTGGVIFGN
jgi:hypothetical protein